ncbi:competence protein [Streptococcus pneumoniae]|nr:competence protein [Streptococcus pneumoniae]
MFVARDARGELVNVLEDKLEKQAYTWPIRNPSITG